MKLNKYRCPQCKKEVIRESTKKWIPSYCSETGKNTRLQLIETELSQEKLKELSEKFSGVMWGEDINI